MPMLPPHTLPLGLHASGRRQIADREIARATALIALWFLMLAIFHVSPQIDLTVQNLFFKEEACATGVVKPTCGSFPLERSPVMKGLRTGLYYLPLIVAAAMILRLVSLIRSPVAPNPADIHRLIAGLATYALGPGLLVNLILKAHSGRPRPHQTDLFGGMLDFQVAGSFSGACRSNCSFVSGEASAGAWLICMALLLAPPARRIALPVAIGLCLLGAMLRVAFGRHYFSDVVLAVLSTFAVFAVVLACLRKGASPKSHQ